MAESGDNTLNPWERRNGETDKAWHCFEVYRGMYPKDRSVDAVYRTCYSKDMQRRAPKFIQDWSRQNDWNDRAAAYDRHLDTISLQATDKVVEKEAEKQARKWSKRRETIRESGWERYERLLNLSDLMADKCEVIAKLPVTRKIIVEGEHGEEIHIHPMDVTPAMAATMARAAAKLVEAADKVGRMAAEMETERLVMQLVDEINMDELTDAEIDRLRSAKSPNDMQRELRLISGGKAA